MATRSRIAIEHADGTVESIYCHNDGYPSANGLMLYTYYSKREKVEALINLGDISYLSNLVEPLGEDHTFNNPEPDVTVAYHRDRGENYNKKRHASKKDFFNSDIEEYGYLFTKENEWKFRSEMRAAIFPVKVAIQKYLE